MNDTFRLALETHEWSFLGQAAHPRSATPSMSQWPPAARSGTLATIRKYLCITHHHWLACLATRGSAEPETSSCCVTEVSRPVAGTHRARFGMPAPSRER